VCVCLCYSQLISESASIYLWIWKKQIYIQYIIFVFYMNMYVLHVCSVIIRSHASTTGWTLRGNTNMNRKIFSITNLPGDWVQCFEFVQIKGKAFRSCTADSWSVFLTLLHRCGFKYFIKMPIFICIIPYVDCHA